MIFTETDRVTLKIVHENLGTVLLGVGFRTDAKSLHQRFHEVEQRLATIEGLLAGPEGAVHHEFDYHATLLAKANDRLLNVEESQGKLYSALNAMDEILKGLVTREQMISALTGVAARLDVRGKLDGIRDGLVDEIKQLTAAVSFFAETALNRKAKRRSKKR